jgi:hypothetical protein
MNYKDILDRYGEKLWLSNEEADYIAKQIESKGYSTYLRAQQKSFNYEEGETMRDDVETLMDEFEEAEANGTLNELYDKWDLDAESSRTTIIHDDDGDSYYRELTGTLEDLMVDCENGSDYDDKFSRGEYEE